MNKQAEIRQYIRRRSGCVPIFDKDGDIRGIVPPKWAHWRNILYPMFCWAGWRAVHKAEEKFT